MGAHVLSSLAALLLSLPLTASSAGLGKLTISSALGQPLAAEIDLLSVTPEEADSLNVRMATAEAFRDARVDPAPILASVRFSIEKRADGKPYLKLSSSKPITDPFLDMVVEMNWAGGRLLREYTVLLDPPAKAEPQSVAPVAPAVVAPAAPPQPATEAKPESPPAAPAAAGDSYTVKRGDSLSKIAKQLKPEGVSLEQTMLGLFETNPDAFGDKNMNHLQMGRIMQVPGKDALAAIDAKRARREVALHTSNWSGYRDRLAGQVKAKPSTAEGAPRASAGRITPRVEDKSAPAASQDVLKLSKGEAPAGKGAANTRALQERVATLEEDLTARGKDLDEKNQRVAMLEKNLEEMRKLLELQKQPAPAPAPAPEAAPAPEPQAQTPAPKPAEPPAAPAPAPAPEQSGGIFTNPIYLGGGLAAILAGWLGWMVIQGRRRKKGLAGFEDSIMTGGDLKASTLFGSTAKGGAVDTGSTSFLTEFSQAGLGSIDTHDVDPIAEADVYMAYGRDAQAEEILKEAMLKDPGRHELHVKLLEIYAARKNLPAFETVASELYAALGGKPSPLWDKAAEMGRQLDPTNPLYGAKDAGAGAAVAATAAAAVAASASADVGDESFDTAFAEEPVEVEAVEVIEPEAEPDTLDFDMAFDTIEPEPAVAKSAPAASDDNLLDFNLDDLSMPEADAPTAEASVPDEVMSFELPEEVTEIAEEAPDAELAAPVEDALESVEIEAFLAPANEPAAEAGIDLDFDFPLEEPEPVAEAVTAAPEAPAIAMPDLDLDLGAATEASDAEGAVSWDEVSTKLDLARAYLEMGDKEGAGEILQEVLAEGDEKQRGEASGLLADLG
jgi:pilus assembly protein FimV